MSNVTITLSPESAARLEALAKRSGIRPEEIARAGVEELLSAGDEVFENALSRTLSKNAELYRRLAS